MTRYIIAAAGLVTLGAFAVAGWLVYACFIPEPKFPKPIIISVNRGDSLAVVANRLAAAGVVRSARVTELYAEVSGGAARNLKPGDYAFRGGEDVGTVLRHIVQGDFIAAMVTIPEGSTVHQIAERMEEAGLACEWKFQAAARRGPLVRALGLEPLGAEGYLFPATYRFPPHASSEEILATMLQRFYAVLTPAMQRRLFVLGMSVHDLVTLASIIEKEAEVPGERPIIASVFYNRLKLGMPLQSDPTAQYNPSGETEPAVAAVRAVSGYNTYKFVGLPPGPIANPGMSSIMAALYPAHTDYLYFVARKDGTHIFSRTLREQQRAIALVKRLAGADQRAEAPVASAARQ
jgi:peptidoglycan lytic transglycosylase G